MSRRRKARALRAAYGGPERFVFAYRVKHFGWRVAFALLPGISAYRRFM